MAYANLKSKSPRKRAKGHLEKHLTGWWYLYRLLGTLRLKGLATLVFAHKREVLIIYKNGEPWKSFGITLRKQFKWYVTGTLPTGKSSMQA